MRERGLLNLGYRVPPAGRQRGVFRVGEFSTGTMGNFQPELTQMSDSSENLQKRARLRHDRNVEAVSSFGVRSPYRPGITRGTTGPALRQIEREHCQEMGLAERSFLLEPRACCPAACKSFISGSANGNRTRYFTVQFGSVGSKWFCFRSSSVRDQGVCGRTDG